MTDKKYDAEKRWCSMIAAQTLCTLLGGHWYGHYGAAPCPVCQPERRKGQNALTISDGFSSLLANCKKAGCSFQQIAAASGLVRGRLAAQCLRQKSITIEMSDTFRLLHDKTDFTDKTKCHATSIGKHRDTLGLAAQASNIDQGNIK
jgi:hypothetical protein